MSWSVEMIAENRRMPPEAISNVGRRPSDVAQLVAHAGVDGHLGREVACGIEAGALTRSWCMIGGDDH
ncbi:integrase catalytic region [Rhizobium grahamii]|uniref:Integrase catalytic region n=1 Tax=Rhizobium grahamii TaxID=1120045 RepID=A0A370KI11_9HYPH|nr:integrase catalytic region [Rhizobium grahamii]RDJ05526.1 integrase catalytic region [Rhizobium grahamii]